MLLLDTRFKSRGIALQYSAYHYFLEIVVENPNIMQVNIETKPSFI